MGPLTSLLLKRASASRQSGEWNEDDYDVLEDGAVVGRIFKVHAAPVDSPWMWTLAFWHHEDRTPTLGYEATREAAMAAFVKGGNHQKESMLLPKPPKPPPPRPPKPLPPPASRSARSA